MYITIWANQRLLIIQRKLFSVCKQGKLSQDFFLYVKQIGLKTRLFILSFFKTIYLTINADKIYLHIYLTTGFEAYKNKV